MFMMSPAGSFAIKFEFGSFVCLQRRFANIRNRLCCGQNFKEGSAATAFDHASNDSNPFCWSCNECLEVSVNQMQTMPNSLSTQDNHGTKIQLQMNKLRLKHEFQQTVWASFGLQNMLCVPMTKKCSTSRSDSSLTEAFNIATHGAPEHAKRFWCCTALKAAGLN